MKGWHVSWDPIESLANDPMWFWLEERHAKNLQQNIRDYDGVDAIIYESNITGNVPRVSEVEELFNSSGLDIYDYEAMLTENPEAEEILAMEGTMLLLDNGYDGIIHYDYDPENHGDAESLLVFNPSKTVKFSINERKNQLKITKRQLKRIIREAISQSIKRNRSRSYKWPL